MAYRPPPGVPARPKKRPQDPAPPPAEAPKPAEQGVEPPAGALEARPDLPPAAQPGPVTAQAPQSAPEALPVPPSPTREVDLPALTFAAWVKRAPTPGTRQRYEAAVRMYLTHVLGLDPRAEWEGEALLARYRLALDKAGAGGQGTWTAAWLQDWVGRMRDEQRADGSPRFEYGTLSWRYAVVKNFAEWAMQGEVPRWAAREVWRSIAGRKGVERVRAGLTPEILGRLMVFLQTDSAAWVSLARSSGGRPWELSSLRAIDLDTGPSPWRVSFHTTKEGGESDVPRVSFADLEAQRRLRPVLDTRGDTVSPYLFSALGPTPKLIYRQVHRDWLRALKRLGLDQRGNDGRLVYRLYRLRSYFRTFGGRKQGFGRDVAEVCMGHHGDETEAAYARYKDNLDLLAEDYRAGEAALYCEARA